MQQPVEMDQPTESAAFLINEVPSEETPSETSNNSNNTQVRAEPDCPPNNLANVPDLEIGTPPAKPNEELRAFVPDSKVQDNDDPEPDNLSKGSEEGPLDETSSNERSDNELSSDEEFEFASDDQFPSDSDSGSSDDDGDFDPIDYITKPTKKRPRKEGKKKAKTSVALTEKVKDLMSSKILSTANANANASDVPGSQKKDKSKALAEVIAKLPKNDRLQAKKDVAELIESSKRFTPSAKIVTMNWEVRGLNTLLKHHQLKAAAWMLDRESSEEEPNGGLLCDEMGLGKTLTALEKISKDVLEHFAGSQTRRQDVAKAMRQKRIVLTTYEQVCNSYPKLKPPVTIKTPEELEAWREEEFNCRVGPLHKVEWHRIVLDEAHSIKNKDSATSIAIRALNGKFKWALSGTPLHNGVGELYPYLHFIFTSERMEYQTFLKKYSKGLDQILETVLHRSTYSTQILGRPIVTLPGIINRVVEVELCQAERHLYREIQDVGIAMLTGLAQTKERPTRCILAVITMLRMFVSHPLLAQKFLEVVLNQGVIKALKAMAEEKGVAETPSGIIISLILAMGDKVAPRPKPPGSFSELLGIYHKHMMKVRKEEGVYAELSYKICPLCIETVKEYRPFVITSCYHLYCKGCFDGLPDQDGKIDTATRVCSSCKKPIEEAGYSDDSPKTSPKKGSPMKRKQSTPKPKGKNIFAKRPRSTFKKQVLHRDPSDDEWDEPVEDADDWVARIGNRMPSAKTTAILDLIAKWMKEDENVKIVIFVQFLKTVQILQYMFDEEGWEYAIITGKVSPTSRDQQIEKFGKDKDIKIMISSLKTGGVGLNLTMANKCILVDPWWNEAIQDQAYCRLYRIGQPRLVEYVQIVAKGSIDTWMINLQKEKTRNIHQLFSADSLKEILGFSGDIHEKPDGGFSILTSKENNHAHTWAQCVETGILNVVDSLEED
ncbi:SNF2 family helicase, putative [Penicillium digitatum PHI26]|uniref:SNF2 family helicase, putative n=2 Tax=Penicillium digitatum TaxID=36651 RepID=K9FRI6_PEND2|nr:SNF2 family helicase, putative [Penicillium digitatum Pd1]EKV11056.1 SNF2 family helicase, putative [Penicillium digitatum Pd1]EKV11779.1 SNF2 family helicase, putative [Penicillium digitatum PHI26]